MENKLIKLIFLFCAISMVVGCSIDEAVNGKVLVDATSKVSAGSTVYTRFQATRAATVKVEVNVTDGDGVKVYLVDDDNMALLLKNKEFQCYTALSSTIAITSFKKSATLPAGNWNIAVVNPNLLLSQTVSRKITCQ